MRARVAVAGALIGSVVVLVAPQPASAAVTATTTGTTLTISLTGDQRVKIGCLFGNAGVEDLDTDVFTTGSPALACSAVTAVVVNGDFGPQYVDSRPIISAPFTANPTLGALLGDGTDTLWETDRNDTIFMGGDKDSLTLYAGTVANTTLNLGTGTDNLSLEATDSADTVTMASTNDDLSLVLSGGASSSWAVADAENISVSLGKGNDSGSFAGVTGASGLGYMTLNGNEGDDTLTSSAKGSFLYGGAGTNTFNFGPGLDSADTDSDTDIINSTADTTSNYVDDFDSLRFGGRTLNGFGGTGQSRYQSGFYRNDVTLRVRPGSSGSAVVTSSLNRTGQQVLPVGIDYFEADVEGTQSVSNPDIAHRSLVDAVAVGQELSFTDAGSSRDLFDITIPTGSWTETVSVPDRRIQPSTAGLGRISIPATAVYRVHGPWANQTDSFAWRIYRDLLFRFPSESVQEDLSEELTAGGITRKEAVEGLVGTDEYRGLDVDRTFVKYLRRTSDAGGRTYWINSIRNGKALWRFRAQLFGGNEYFTKAGGTNALYVAKAYEDVLGRKPDPSGQAYWTNKLNNGADRGSVALQFINSPEARRRLVDDQFLRFLDRKPTTGEQTTWVNALPGATGEQDLITSLAATAAYYDRT